MSHGKLIAPSGALLALLACACVLFATPATATAPRFSALYVFGDSWTDDNGFNGTWKAFKQPPSPPNQFRFSNGPTFPFYVARDGGLNCLWANSTDTLGIKCPFYVNFGQGGACAARYPNNADVRSSCATGTNPSLPLPDQVTTFENQNYAIQANDLFLISIGGNDLNGWLQASGFGNKLDAIFSLPQQARGQILEAIRRLYNKGGRRFFIMNVPDVLTTPRGITMAATQSSLVIQFVDEFIESYVKDFNADVIGAARAEFPAATIYNGNLRGCMKQKAKGDYGGWSADGYTMTTEPCIADRNSPNATVCANIGATLWWDSVHPTTRWHEWLGGQVIKILDGGNETNTCLATKCIGDSIFDVCHKNAALSLRPNFVWTFAVVVASIIFGMIVA